jgi:hypothetical protein
VGYPTDALNWLKQKRRAASPATNHAHAFEQSALCPTRLQAQE